MKRQPRRHAGPTPAPPSLLARLAETSLVLTLLVPPFVVLPPAREAFRLPKLLVSEWLAVLSLLLAAIAAIRVPTVPGPRPEWRAPAVLALAPLVLVALAGAPFTTHPAHYREAFTDLLIGALIVVGWQSAFNAAQLLRALTATMAAGAVLSLLALDQGFGLLGLLAWLPVDEQGRYAITSTAGNAGDLAAYLVLPCVLAQWRLWHSHGPRSRAAAAGTLAAGLAALALTQTLAALAALAIASTAFWLMVLPRHRSMRVAGLAAAAAVLLLLLSPGIRGRVIDKAAAARSGNLNDILTGRLDGWRSALFMIESEPWIGVGAGGFRPAFIPAKRVLLDRGVVFYPAQHRVVFASAHSEPLQVAAEFGLPGVLAACWGLAVVAVALRRLPREDGRRAFALSAAAAYATLAAVDFPFRTALVAVPALVFLAWVFRTADAERQAGASPSPRPAARRWIWPVLLGAVLAALAWRMANRLSASMALAAIEQRTTAAFQARRAPPDLIPRHIEALRRIGQLDPSEVGVPVALGTQHLLLAQAPAALAAYREAEALEPRPEIYLNLGRALLMSGAREDADRHFSLAARLDPTLAAEVARALQGPQR